MKNKKWLCKKSEIIIDTKFLKIRKDAVKLPTGKNLDWLYWDSLDSVMVIGRTKNSKLIMIKQYRYLVGRDVIEFPSGGMDKGESPSFAAKREFEEETGYKCKKLIKLGSFYETYGQLNRKIHIYFANNTIKSKQLLDNGDNEYEDIEVILVDFNKAVDLAFKNKIDAMGSTLAILLLKEKIDKKEIIFN